MQVETETMPAAAGDPADAPKFQVLFESNEHPKMLRDLTSNQIGRLVVVPGIITSAAKTQLYATKILVRCRNCQHEKEIPVKIGFGGA